MRTIIGIDPGMTGAIAIFPHGKFSCVIDIPCTRDTNKSKLKIDTHKLVDLLCEYVWGIEGTFGVYMELAHAMPGQGVSSMFAYGRSNGLIEGVLAGLGFTDSKSTINKVPPAVWKRRLGLISNAHPKDAGIKCARKLYPSAELNLKKHHNRADAILIGHYGCLVEGQGIK